MATTSTNNPLLELVGPELYEAFFGDETEVGGATATAREPLDCELDRLLLEASESYEQKYNLPATVQRFAVPKTEKEVIKAQKAIVPQKTQHDTNYCVRLWNQWKAHRNGTTTSEKIPEELTTMGKEAVQYWLSRFILEVRKKDGSEYPANTLHHITCGLMRHLRQNGQPEIDFFKDPTFSDFRATLDSEMKRVQSKGIGSKKRQAEPLTVEEEELLWESGQLGHHSPQALVDTMFFMCGIYFALRSGQEHRMLRFQPSQIELIEQPGQRAFLRYTEDISKNNPGGLKGRKNKPKVVIQHENEEEPNRCFVRLYKLYESKCPANRPQNAFYLQPLKKPTADCWYSSNPIGHCTLSGTMARLCKSAGISGFKTNHSLRATTATRLYQAGVDEQLIMERTGHHSIDGVRSYKRTNAEQQENLSDILALSKRPKQGLLQPCSTTSALVPAPVSVTSTPQQVASFSSAHTQQQLMIHPDNLQHMFTLSSCSNVNIHVHIQ